MDSNRTFIYFSRLIIVLVLLAVLVISFGNTLFAEKQTPTQNQCQK